MILTVAQCRISVLCHAPLLGQVLPGFPQACHCGHKAIAKLQVSKVNTHEERYMCCKLTSSCFISCTPSSLFGNESASKDPLKQSPKRFKQLQYDSVVHAWHYGSLSPLSERLLRGCHC